MLSDFGLVILYSLISKVWQVATGFEKAGQSPDNHGNKAAFAQLLRRRKAPQLRKPILNKPLTNLTRTLK